MKVTGRGGSPLFIEVDDITLVYENSDPTEAGTICIQRSDGAVLIVKESKEQLTLMIKKEEESKYGPRTQQ